MDVFQTIVSGASIIYTFLDSYSAASEQSRSLAARLKWDLRVIRQFTEHYESRLKDDVSSLSSEEADLVNASAAYLSGLATKITGIAQKLESKGRLRREFNKALWWHRESDIRELEEELFEWTTRLDLRLVGLPSEMRTAIKLDGPAASNMPNLVASQSIRSLRAVVEKADKAAVEGIFRDSVDDYISVVETDVYERFKTIQHADKQLLVERRFHSHPKDSAEWQELKTGLSRLAACLNCLDGTTVSLLHCDYVVHDARNPVSPHFCLVSTLPFPVGPSCPTLKSLITKTRGTVRLPPSHSLSERFQLAQSLATAVFFLHSVSFLHHNITSHNVVMLHRKQATPQRQFPHFLGVPFLVGFEAVKEFHTRSDSRGVLDLDMLYQHPDRLLEANRPKYVPTHDIYSLGMVMLEMAMWRPLERYATDLLDDTKRASRLSELMRHVDVAMGARFRKIVEWCLQMESETQVDPIRFSKEVLEPLEEMNSALR
ncbi:hypothetical protein V8F20_008778 [Naviculisporaceae sp. PSN 640]